MKQSRYLFITDQFETGGVESVFINIANNLNQHIVLLPVHKNLNPNLINSLPKNVELLLPTSTFSRSIFGLFRAILMAIKLHKKYGSSKNIVINFSDTLTSMLVAFFINPHNCWSWIHCNPFALLNSKAYHLYWWLLGKCQRLIFLCESQRSLFFKVPLSNRISQDRTVVCTNFTAIHVNDLDSSHDSYVKKKSLFFYCC